MTRAPDESTSLWLELVGMAAGCDVLWGGCPMVTLPLERMASRVAASLCYATGLGPEMVVSSQQEYEVRHETFQAIHYHIAQDPLG